MNTVTITVSDRTIADLLCSAIEGGSNYWIGNMSPRPGKRAVKPWGDDYTPSYIEAPFSGSLVIMVSDEDDERSNNTYTLNRARLKQGLQIMAEDYPEAFSEVLADNMDATTGDMFLQCCLFNEVVYG